MTAETAKKKATYEELFSAPDGVTGEIINGDLVVSPKPSPRHAFAAAALASKVSSRYDFREGGGPGGWAILPEVEIMFREDLLAPDWICGIISPGAVGNDRIVKMNIYARSGVRHCWLIDPRDRPQKTFMLQSGVWVRMGAEPSSAMPECGQSPSTKWKSILAASGWMKARNLTPSHETSNDCGLLQAKTMCAQAAWR